MLTPFDWKLYNTIKDETISNGSVSSEKLCHLLNIDVDNDAKKRNISRKSGLIYRRCEYINHSSEVEKTIIWDTKSNYKIAQTKDEIMDFVLRVYSRPAIKKLAKMKCLTSRVVVDGQGKIVSCQGHAIDETSNARDFVEAFLK